ncbi:MAG: nucleotidyl transferase AbiEii/AbiGii toxin family protein [Phascolarctobacterium sp.]|uniref:nucleotidyl transferase AbiEii/AbiGii toxin family protein n=1 Tax=Phascolarctobacterium sp. TaxID=2049039 RepID=UPI0026DC2CC2|nr:nucleotidyl transferase AbiEii/AbiGii toxin family protein [Phascolarctobacterium sp.]MDO4922241.1 nucleotidyl transferase AbiEii/AbiGii toxin family protein [Phascolarctobacterium sp.]
MLIHNNREEFQELISVISKEKGIEEWIVEKDYYVTIILKYLTQALPDLVFKGGTSLSKCYRIISRFSEDIDLTTHVKPTEGQKRNIKSRILAIIQELNLKLDNPDEILSRRNYNKYIIKYKSVIPIENDFIESQIILETVYKTIAFPVVQLPVNNIMGDYLSEKNLPFIENYQLEPFVMPVQELSRTFADKIFAICDYYLAAKESSNSRHIYDIYMLLPAISLNEQFRALVVDIRENRAVSPVCYSAKTGQNPNQILKNIISERFYERDYNNLTKKLLLEDVSYNQAVQALEEVIASKAFEFCL